MANSFQIKKTKSYICFKYRCTLKPIDGCHAEGIKSYDSCLKLPELWEKKNVG